MKPIWKKSLMIVGIAAVSLLVAFLFREENKRVSKSIFAMDTYMQITAYGKNSRQAVDAAIKEIKRLDDLLSTGNACSEVSVLNQNKKVLKHIRQHCFCDRKAYQNQPNLQNIILHNSYP